MVRFGIMLAALVAAATISAQAADNSLSAAANAAYLAANAKKPGVVVRPSGLQYRIIHNGFGKRPGPTDYVTVYYTGSLINGRVFDGTEPNMPTRFKVNQLVSGWTEALTLMRVGDHWQIVLPAKLGYGEAGTPDGTIPPNQTLVFDLELIKVVPAKMRPHKPDEDPDKVDDNADLGPDDEAQ
ncbi:MAG: FKBP-type peptidyl-prolyl cis-trans isomerase [Rhizomicrobium sp.]|jgi:FKBP-type peptidyl-prolyl cis-trans isomerase FkpA/FKBP-type peptidyl-prolyl cis-trans isomerase FklB